MMGKMLLVVLLLDVDDMILSKGRQTKQERFLCWWLSSSSAGG